jgi:hypothetical protein
MYLNEFNPYFCNMFQLQLKRRRSLILIAQQILNLANRGELPHSNDDHLSLP